MPRDRDRGRASKWALREKVPWRRPELTGQGRKVESDIRRQVESSRGDSSTSTLCLKGSHRPTEIPGAGT